MLGHGAKFSQKKEQAIAALLSHRNVDEAARAVGISANTLLRWRKEPEFETACREARRATVSQAIERIQDATGAAVTTVLKVMLDANAPAGTRLRAAEIVLERAAKAGEMEDIEARVAKLERKTCSAGTSRKRSTQLTLPSATVLSVPANQALLGAPRLDNAETDEDVVE